MTSAIFSLTNVVILACLAILALCASLAAMADSSTSSGAGKLNVHHYIDVGMNFPYYVLARTDLRIPPFAEYDPAYKEIRGKYGKIDVDWESVPRVNEAWWDWLWRVGNNGPYESVEQAIAHIHSKEGDAEFNAATEKLKSVTDSLVSDYVKHWKDIRTEVNAIVDSILESFPTEEILNKNEELMGRTYEPAEAVFYYNFLRTTTAQSRSNERNGGLFCLYIVGLDYLQDAEGFAGFMAHELRHILINQSGVFEREDIQDTIGQLHSLTEGWRDSSEVGCIIENMNFVLDAWSEHGRTSPAHWGWFCGEGFRGQCKSLCILRKLKGHHRENYCPLLRHLRRDRNSPSVAHPFHICRRFCFPHPRVHPAAR